MKKFIALLVFTVSLFVTTADAQCPEISIAGSARMVRPGENMKFTAAVSRIDQDPPLKYAWSVSSGTIISGQGTSSIEVAPEGTSLTASVDIRGLPESCPTTASESALWHPAPAPIKIGVWKDDSDFSPLQQFAIGLAAASAHQGYVFIVRGSSSRPHSLAELRKHVLDYSSHGGAVSSSRVTIVEAEGPEELVEFWRVPPGANNPECESCRKPQCPELSISGPKGPPNSGDLMKFSLSITGEAPRGLRYEWTVSAGHIIAGQKTRSIQVLAPPDEDWNLAVTANVTGLASGCPSSVTETIMPGDRPNSVLIDEFSIIPEMLDLQRLSVAAEEIKNNPSNQLFVALYHPKLESQFKVREVIRKLTEFFSSKPELGRDYFSIVSSPSDDYLLRIYRVPPGAHKPTP